MMNTPSSIPCSNCQTPFIPNKISQKFCSESCRRKAGNTRYYENVKKERQIARTAASDELQKLLIERYKNISEMVDYGNKHPEAREQLKEELTRERLLISLFDAPRGQAAKLAANVSHAGHQVFDKCYSITIAECQNCGKIVFAGYPRQIPSRYERQKLYFWLDKKYKIRERRNAGAQTRI